MTQTENDLAELCRVQTEELTECQRGRDSAFMALRAIINTIEDETRIYVPQFIGREYEVLAIAKKALKEAE